MWSASLRGPSVPRAGVVPHDVVHTMSMAAQGARVQRTLGHDGPFGRKLRLGERGACVLARARVLVRGHVPWVKVGAGGERAALRWRERLSLRLCRVRGHEYTACLQATAVTPDNSYWRGQELRRARRLSQGPMVSHPRNAQPRAALRARARAKCHGGRRARCPTPTECANGVDCPEAPGAARSSACASCAGGHPAWRAGGGDHARGLGARHGEV